METSYFKIETTLVNWLEHVYNEDTMFINEILLFIIKTPSF